jgi:ABC-type transport system involved in cytochrome c biogenesis ATPase subunit
LDDIFLGRERQMQDLGRVLSEFFDASRAPTLPPVVLISGQGGIGKSTLLRELHAMAQERFKGRYHRLDIDWQVQRQENLSAFADAQSMPSRAGK